jgi:glycosyltransferase involved in cell wall biosynthesis
MVITPIIVLITGILVFHLFYQIFFLAGMLRLKAKPHSDNIPGISIIVAARNEYHNLQQLVPLILDQAYPDFELIIVNDRSDDESFDYLMELNKNPLINVVFIDHLPDHVNSKKYALKLGIKAAKNDHLLFTDADCLPSSNEWINGMISSYKENTEIVLGFSPYQSAPGFLNALIRFETHFTGIQYLSSASNNKAYMGVGRNLSYRKNFFLSKKGFNEFLNITGGDDDLFVNKSATSTNTSVALKPGSTTISIPKKSWREYIKQKVRHMSVGKYYRSGDRIFLGFFSFLHIFSGISLVGVLVYDLYPIIFGTTFLISYILFMMNFWMLNKKSGSRFSLWLVPIIDVVYMFFYIFVGMRTLVTKKVEWTT